MQLYYCWFLAFEAVTFLSFTVVTITAILAVTPIDCLAVTIVDFLAVTVLLDSTGFTAPGKQIVAAAAPHRWAGFCILYSSIRNIFFTIAAKSKCHNIIL